MTNYLNNECPIAESTQLYNFLSRISLRLFLLVVASAAFKKWCKQKLPPPFFKRPVSSPSVFPKSPFSGVVIFPFSKFRMQNFRLQLSTNGDRMSCVHRWTSFFENSATRRDLVHFIHCYFLFIIMSMVFSVLLYKEVR